MFCLKGLGRLNPSTLGAPVGVPLVPGTGADGLAAAASAPEPGPSAKATRSGRSVTTSARAAASAEQEAQARQGRLFSATNSPEKPPGDSQTELMIAAV